MNSEFLTKDKIYLLDEKIRNAVKPGWQEMLNPAKSRTIPLEPVAFSYGVEIAEKRLMAFGETLVGKKVLEAGCNEGARSYWMAKYQDTYVHGIDVDDYTVDQSPDLNVWNPKDVAYVHGKFDEMRSGYAKLFPKSVADKVTFETSGMEQYATPNPYDVIVSWDTLEHIIDLPLAFRQMANSLKPGGICYHEYNPFFAINGGHSLCTLDFFFGHVLLSKEDFERYVKENRPEEEKIDLNFYNKCLNRATRFDVQEYAVDAGFEILHIEGSCPFKKEHDRWKAKIETEYLPVVQKNYPTAVLEDLMCDFVYIILRKK